MSNFELIDEYITNRLSEQDRVSFEQEVAANPRLKSEVDLQKEVIKGLQAARVAELKAMLNTIPVAAPTSYVSPLRIAAGIIGTAVVATGLYYYVNKKDIFNPPKVSPSLVDSIQQSEPSSPVIKEGSEPPIIELNKGPKPVENNDQVSPPKEDANIVGGNTKEKSKPAIDLVDPTEDLTDNEPSSTPVKSGANNTTISVAKINVDVISSERKYKSHYQFVNGKLILYGNFDSGLYEIIEVNAQHSRSLFLYFQSAYFLLDESQHVITGLKEISDPVLKEKLKAFRSN